MKLKAILSRVNVTQQKVEVMQIKGFGKLFGLTHRGETDLSNLLGSWACAELTMQSRNRKWQPGLLILSGFYAGTEKSQNEICQNRRKAVAQIDDARNRQSCQVTVLFEYKTAGAGIWTVQAVGEPLIGAFGEELQVVDPGFEWPRENRALRKVY